MVANRLKSHALLEVPLPEKIHKISRQRRAEPLLKPRRFAD
jgi:hypothetical protein